MVGTEVGHVSGKLDESERLASGEGVTAVELTLALNDLDVVALDLLDQVSW